MASDKNIIVLYSSCSGKELLAATSTNISLIKSKGFILSNVKAEGDYKDMIYTAGTSEKFADIAIQENLIVGTLDEQFDLCFMEAGNTVSGIENELTAILEKVARKTLLILIVDGVAIYYGLGIAKGKSLDKEVCACSILTTAAYIVNLPLPQGCEAPILLPVLKDINMKFKTEKKLVTTIANMESAIERQSRQPWDKHDCA